MYEDIRLRFNGKRPVVRVLLAKRGPQSPYIFGIFWKYKCNLWSLGFHSFSWKTSFFLCLVILYTLDYMLVVCDGGGWACRPFTSVKATI